MPDHASIEEILGRLMPQALSDGGRASIEEMLDGLAPEEESVDAGPLDQGVQGAGEERRPWKWLLAPAGVAAAVSFAFFFSENPDGPVTVPLVAMAAASEFTVVGETGRIDRMSDAGLLSDPDGSALQGIRMRVVEENTLRDEETGLLIRVSQPREELLLVPVSAF